VNQHAMQRRSLLTLLGASTAACPLMARAQQRGMQVVGYVNNRAPGEDAQLFAAFRQGLRDIGFAEGQNVAFDYRWPGDKPVSYQALVAELASQRVAIIAAIGDFAALAAAEAIPLIMGSCRGSIDLAAILPA
jgi:putative tryptophan/tyrosine transport system substrate-binding protein